MATTLEMLPCSATVSPTLRRQTSGGTNSTCGADGSVIYTDVAAHRNWISYYLQF
ncbi:MAG: hypothetical protein ACRDQW_04005 [Haloechinothrix sp.]